MARSRSRSPARRERRRSRSRSRDRERDRRRERHRSRSTSPRRRRSRSPRRRSRSPRRRSRSRSQDRGQKGEKKGAVPKFLMDRPTITEKDLEGKSAEEQEMMKLMGFGDFETTKGKRVPGNNVFGLHVIHKRKYRQYMNRKGGFNRPLDFVS